MRSHVLIAISSVSLGIGIGWIAFGQSDQAAGSPVGQTSVPRQESASDRSDAESGEARGLRSMLASDEIDLDAFVKVRDELNPTELRGVVEWLARQGGIQGLDSRKKSYLRSLVYKWYQLDPESALRWIASRDLSEDRQFHICQIASEMGAQDLPSAIDFLEEHVDEAVTYKDFPYDLFSLAAKQDPDLLVRLCALSVHSGSGGFGIPVDFPDRFDFRRCMDGFTSIVDGLRDGQRISNMPTNLISEWTKVDPQAAFEWALAAESGSWGDHTIGREPLAEFFSGLASSSDTNTYGSFVADFYLSPSDAENVASQTWTALSAKADSRTIESFLAGVSPDGNPDDVISAILPNSFNQFGQGPESLRSELFARMTPAGQLAFIKDQASIAGASRAFLDLVRTLPQHGHSEEEIRQATEK